MPSAPAPGAPPFFIVGNDRSGTTALRLVVDRSREAAVPPESMFLVDFASVRRRGNLGDPEQARRFLAQVWSHPKVKLWKLLGDPPSLPRLGHIDMYRFILESPYRAYAHAEGKKRFGDKTPSYLHALDEIFAVWPDARVVVLVRDGRDVALSIMRLPFGPNNVCAAARWWAHGIRVGLKGASERPGQVITCRYEDLVADPAEEARRVCEHLGLAFHENMLAIEHSDPDKIVADQAGWFTNVWAGINATAVGKWRYKLSAREREIFAAVAGEELAALGYEVEQPVRATSVSRPRLFAYVAHDVVLRGLNFVRLRLLRERGREVRYVFSRKVRRV